MYAVIEACGKQYKVTKGDIVFFEKLDVEEGKKVVFDKVLMANGKVGSPYLEGATVKATVEKQGRAKKIIVFKYKSKKNYHKKQGHRQPYTKVKITAIVA